MHTGVGERAMKIRVFNIRLTDGLREQDEARLNEFLETVVVKQIFASIAHAGVNLWSVLLYYEDEVARAIPANVPADDEESEQPVALSPDEERLYQDLKRWRNERATQEGIPPYMIAHNAWLQAMVRLPVHTLDDLLRIKGFGERRIQKYGDEILKVLYGEGDSKAEYFDF
jgi:superfamily II DNA helicase RecQ